MVTRMGFGGLVAAIASGVPLVAAAQEPGAGVMVAVVGFSALGVVLVLGIIVIALRHDARTHRQRIALIEQYLQQGREVPRELLQPRYDGRTPAERRQYGFRRAIVLLAWAVGIAVVFYVVSGQLRAMVWGLPFLLLGVAHVFNGVFFSDDGAPRGGDGPK